jgi:hypothetical protein
VPGIYINDSGGTSSALGNILGNIATNLGPEAAARAQELQQQTMGLDLDNQLKRMHVTGATGIPGVLGAANADPTLTPPAGTVPGALAAVAQPPGPAPGTFGAANPTVNFSPAAKVLAGSYATDPGMGNLTTGVNLFKDIKTGPGTDYATANTKDIAQHAPVTISAGQQHIGDPTLAAAGVNSILGPSPYDQKVADTMGGTNPVTAQHDLDVGADANINLGKAQAILAAYNTAVAPEYTPGGLLSEKLAANASAYTGLPVAAILKMSAPEVKAMIRTQFASMVSNLRDNMGDPMFKGGLPQILQQFPDPDASPDQFRAATQSLITTLQQQKADGDAALAWFRKPTQNGFVDLMGQKAQHAAEARAAFAAAGVQDNPESGGKTTTTTTTAPVVFPDEATMDEAGAAGTLKPGTKVQVGGRVGTYQPPKAQ